MEEKMMGDNANNEEIENRKMSEYIDGDGLLEKKKKEFEERALELEKKLFEQAIREETLIIEKMKKKLEDELLLFRGNHIISMIDVEKRLALQELSRELKKIKKKTSKLEKKYDVLRRAI